MEQEAGVVKLVPTLLQVPNAPLQIFFFFCLLLFRAALVVYGSSQARDLMGAVATDLHHSHSHCPSATYTTAHGNADP